jgi:hypothetical protein
MTKEEAARRKRGDSSAHQPPNPTALTNSPDSIQSTTRSRVPDQPLSLDALNSTHSSSTPNTYPPPTDSQSLPHSPRSPAVDRTMAKAHKQADKSERHHAHSASGHDFDEPPDRTLGTLTERPAAGGATLPVVEEAAGEGGSSRGDSRSPQPAERTHAQSETVLVNGEGEKRQPHCNDNRARNASSPKSCAGGGGPLETIRRVINSDDWHQMNVHLDGRREGDREDLPEIPKMGPLEMEEEKQSDVDLGNGRLEAPNERDKGGLNGKEGSGRRRPTTLGRHTG